MSTTHKVTLKLKDPSYTEGDQMYPGDLEAEGETVWHVDPGQCNHADTICMTCVRDWTEGYLATVHFGPESGVQPSFSLNQMVELQDGFITAAQLLHQAIEAIFDGAGNAANTIVKMVSSALKPHE